MPLKQGNCGFFEGGHRALPCFGGAQSFIKGRGMQILEIGDELVDGAAG
jgi:hypothetical protein